MFPFLLIPEVVGHRSLEHSALLEFRPSDGSFFLIVWSEINMKCLWRVSVHSEEERDAEDFLLRVESRRR